MNHPLLRRDDLNFLLFEWLGIERTLEQPAFLEHDRETVEAVLDLSEKLAVESFLPHYKSADIEEPQLGPDGVQIHSGIVAALQQYAELGLFSVSFSTELGGFGLPFSVSVASYAMFVAANASAAAYPLLTAANARLIAAFGSKEQVDYFAKPQIEGRWFGTMCLSEPQAGSSLADVKTRAVKDGADALGDRYRLFGNKMWISGGDQDASENIVHLVLAKVPDQDGHLKPGTGGISLFIVPKILPDGARNDVSVAGLNHKMGYRGTSNCLLNFGEADGATGWLIGAEGDGLRQMFLMMNEARISVGIGAAAIAYRGYRHALAYAQERLQGRIGNANDGEQLPIIEHPDVKRMLLAQKAYSEGALALCLYCADLMDREDDPEVSSLLALLIPVAKTWPSEFGLAANDLAIQVHGGYGYTRDFDVEQLYRDNRLNPIHEGTTGIQGLDLLGRKILRNSDALEILDCRIAETMTDARGYVDLAKYADLLELCWSEIRACIEKVRELPEANRLDDATPFLFGFGHGVMAWIWLDLAIAAKQSFANVADANGDLQVGKLAACKYFFRYELPKVSSWLAPIGDVNKLLEIESSAF